MHPEWYYYDCYWYVGLASLNLAGISQQRFTAHHPEVAPKLYEFLDRWWAELGDTNGRWRQKYAFIHQGLYMDSFRGMLVDLHVPAWTELSICRSVWEYKGLDLFAKVFAHGMRPDEEAWFMLNCRPDVYPTERQEFAPEQWYLLCDHLISYGQKYSISQSQITTVDNPYVFALHFPSDPTVQSRLAVWEQELASGIPNNQGKGKGKATPAVYQ